MRMSFVATAVIVTTIVVVFIIRVVVIILTAATIVVARVPIRHYSYDLGKPREICIKVLIALHLNLALVGLLTVLVVEVERHLHLVRRNHPERREPHLIELPVIHQINEYLRRPRVRAGFGECQGA